jgi:PHP family Zn ribbon phosphoesterase
MIADINEQGRLSVRTETSQESESLRGWLADNVKLSKEFTDCCNNRKCAFSFDLKDPKMIEQTCAVCGKTFEGTVLIEVCPTCYV